MILFGPSRESRVSISNKLTSSRLIIIFFSHHTVTSAVDIALVKTYAGSSRQVPVENLKVDNATINSPFIITL